MHTKAADFPAPASWTKWYRAVLLEVPVAHCSQRVAKEPNAAGMHLIAWIDSALQLLLWTGNRVYEPWDSTVDMQSVGEYSTSFYAFLSYSKLSYLTCTGVWRMSPKQKVLLGWQLWKPWFTFPPCASPHCCLSAVLLSPAQADQLSCCISMPCMATITRWAGVDTT